jgi:hypothetical protein
MSRATTLTFAQDLAVVSSNSASLGDYYDAQILELGKLGMTTAVATQAGLSGTKTYQAATTATDLWAVFYGGIQTPLVGHRELEAVAADWRSQPSGVPQIATIEGEADMAFSFFPTPNSNQTITTIISQIITDAPTWLEGHLTFEALAREFSRETAQQDMNFSQAARFLANLLGKMVF